MDYQYKSTKSLLERQTEAIQSLESILYVFLLSVKRIRIP